MGAGRTERHRNLPLSSSDYAYLDDNAYSIEGGVEVPLEAGAVVNVGGALRQTIKGRTYDRSFFRSLAGVQISIPLLKNRGMADFGFRKSIALAEYNQAGFAFVAQCQELRHAIELAYIDAREAQINRKIKEIAVQRFAAFQEEAKELARLKTVADYEVSTTSIELQIGKDDLEIAENLYKLSLETLETLIGDKEPVRMAEISGKVDEAYRPLAPVAQCEIADAMTARGDAAAVKEGITLAEIAIQQNEEASKDDLYLNAGVTFQADGRDYPTQAHRDYDHYVGAEVSVVWRHPLGGRGPKARIAQARAKALELKATYEQKQREIQSQLTKAKLAIASAELRVELTRRGIQAAEDTVRAEQERFKIGEGSSKAVLDAQKNLNAILLRLNTAYSALLRARADYAFAAGYDKQ